jgi:uncharacterized membrane protein YphA (DoxX/SURF4 family)
MNNIIKISRIFLGIMFLFSGISKIISLPFFDSMVAELFLGANYYDNASGLQLTQMLSRVLIASEMLLGAAVMQEKWLKKIVLPALFAMLFIFTLHLFYEGLTSSKGFIEGNCGCFGDILPMNNLESIIKNVVAMLLAVLVWFKYKDENQMHLSTLVAPIVLGTITLMTMWFTIKNYETTEEPVVNFTETVDTSMSASNADTIMNSDVNSTNTVTKDTAAQKTTAAPVATSADEKTKALLMKAGKLSNGKTMNLEKGEQLVCLFSMTCGHCQEVYKEICEFSSYAKLPQVYLLNFGKEFEQQYFFNQGGTCSFPYFRTEDYTLFKRMLEGESFPRILVIRDGKIVKTWNLDTYSREGFMKFLSIPEKPAKKDGLDLQKPGGWGGEEKKPWE